MSYQHCHSGNCAVRKVAADHTHRVLTPRQAGGCNELCGEVGRSHCSPGQMIPTTIIKGKLSYCILNSVSLPLIQCLLGTKESCSKRTTTPAQCTSEGQCAHLCVQLLCGLSPLTNTLLSFHRLPVKTWTDTKCPVYNLKNTKPREHDAVNRMQKHWGSFK